ncbi:hypothetical protein FISHEDRAFT_76269 [Fistulina hepatica ATCC 64428]|uniref:Uncharacterized protein n=1 Tax=Fistulina hepatica ATCC 64428 TaxID=1128425 RepID=A0A0D7A722_9AGAR|nr:hypothetical protein FISHEDRAFT_76269 [Fistulina hepatica ATCC 64428]
MSDSDHHYNPLGPHAYFADPSNQPRITPYPRPDRQLGHMVYGLCMTNASLMRYAETKYGPLSSDFSEKQRLREFNHRTAIAAPLIAVEAYQEFPEAVRTRRYRFVRPENGGIYPCFVFFDTKHPHSRRPSEKAMKELRVKYGLTNSPFGWFEVVS